MNGKQKENGINRNVQRVACSNKCLLVFNGSTKECVLESVSLSGALVKMNSNETGIITGSTCGLYLCHDTQKCPVQFSCQVIHTTSNTIGLKFLV